MIQVPVKGKYEYAILKHQEGAGDKSGVFPKNVWVTRKLNKEEYAGNPTWINLEDNQVELAAGNYKIQATACGYNVHQHRLRWINIDNGETEIIGLNAFSRKEAANVQTSAYLSGIIQVKENNTTFELQHIALKDSEYNEGLGLSIADRIENDDFQEVYAIVEIIRFME